MVHVADSILQRTVCRLGCLSRPGWLCGHPRLSSVMRA